jgi:hypothetical protein
MRLFIIFYYGLLVSCTNTNITPNNPEIEYFKKVKMKVFHDINIKHNEDIMTRISSTSIYYIPQIDFNMEKYNLIKERLHQDGWKFSYSINEKDIYCKNKKMSISFAKPLNDKNESTNNNDHVMVVRAEGKWNIAFDYKSNNIKYCE